MTSPMRRTSASTRSRCRRRGHYRALESLAPQTWTLALVTSDAPSAQITTGGTDAAGLHSYSLAVGLDLDTGDTDIGASYDYAGWRNNVRLAAARTLVTRGGFRVDGLNETFQEEDWAGTLSVGIPFESRPESSWALSFDYDTDYFRQVSEPKGLMNDPNQREPISPLTNYFEAGVGARVSFSNVRSTIYGVGPYTGFDSAVSLRVDHPDFGSDYHAITVSYSVDAYQPLPSTTSMLYVRLTGAYRAGDLVKGAGFALGGIPPQDIAQSIVNSTRTGSTGYLRGYPSRTVAGNAFHLANIEYRKELFLIEHGLATLPIYFRRVQLAAMSDLGTAYNQEFTWSQARASLGGALRLDAFFGWFVPGTFEIGYSHGLVGKDALGETWFLLTGSL